MKNRIFHGRIKKPKILGENPRSGNTACPVGAMAGRCDMYRRSSLILTSL